MSGYELSQERRLRQLKKHMKQITFDRTVRRKKRTSPNFFGTSARPRIVVYRSSKYIYAQAIDDEAKKTVASYSSLQLKRAKTGEGNKSALAKQVGMELAKRLKDLKIKAGVFDRSSYTYLGRVKQLAEGLREGGLTI